VNVAAFTRINPSEHPYQRASLHHFMYRSSYYWPGETDEAIDRVMTFLYHAR
jgi:hypothetical protein